MMVCGFISTGMTEAKFEEMLADPNEQFDPRRELLASILAYSLAPSLTASATPRHREGEVWLRVVPNPAASSGRAADTEEARRVSAKLRLTIEVAGIYADDLEESAALWADGVPTAQDYLNVVIEEWMRPDVGLTIVTIPGEKNLNTDFEVHAYTGRIVGAAVAGHPAEEVEA